MGFWTIFWLNHYIYDISMAFSKCTKLFNTCVKELSLIITKFRAKLQLMLNYYYIYCNKCSTNVRQHSWVIPTSALHVRFAYRVSNIKVNTNYFFPVTHLSPLHFFTFPHLPLARLHPPPSPLAPALTHTQPLQSCSHLRPSLLSLWLFYPGFCYSCGLAPIVVQIRTADDFARSVINSIMP